MAVIATLLFFASLLAHELGHAVQAKRDGMVIEGITLWLFGGVAKFRGAFPSAWAELRIALAGPAVSALLGAGFLALAWLAPLPAAVEAVAWWLGSINVTLLLFNLLPALPLDGGRVLRSLLWGIRGDFAWATRIAATAGRGFGILLIGGGLAMFALWGAFGGVWLAVIGWFLLQAAGAEARAGRTDARLGGLRVRDLMDPHPPAMPADTGVGRLMDAVVWPERHRGYVVLDPSGAPVGLVTPAALRAVPRERWPLVSVGELMTPAADLVLAHPDERAADGLRRAAARDEDLALVVEDGRPVGVLSVSDAVRVLDTLHPDQDARPRR
jgi:Zn-dependent protease